MLHSGRDSPRPNRPSATPTGPQPTEHDPVEAFCRDQKEQQVRKGELKATQDPRLNSMYQYNSEALRFEPRPRDPNTPTRAQRIVRAKKFYRERGQWPVPATARFLRTLHLQNRRGTGRPGNPNRRIEYGPEPDSRDQGKPEPGEDLAELDEIAQFQAENRAKRLAEASRLRSRPLYPAAVPPVSLITQQLEEKRTARPSEGAPAARGSQRVTFGKHAPLTRDGERARPLTRRKATTVTVDGVAVDAAHATPRKDRDEAEAASPPYHGVHSPSLAQLRRQLRANHTGELTDEDSDEADDSPDGVGAGGPHDGNDAAADGARGQQQARPTRLDIVLDKINQILYIIIMLVIIIPEWLRRRNWRRG